MSGNEKRGRVGEPGNINGVAARADTKYQRGQSGNPGGRPALSKAWAAATGGKTMAEVTADALKMVYERMIEGPTADHNGNPNDQDWRFATQKVLEYSAGKPKEHVVFEQADEGAQPSLTDEDLDGIPLEERQQLLLAIRKIRAIRDAKAAKVPDGVTEH